MHELPKEDRRLMCELVGKVKGIACGFSIPDDANDAMRHICDALIEYENRRAESLGAEDGPFASTFAIYADEARASAAKIAEARKRWEVTNTRALFSSVEKLLGHLHEHTHGAQRERIYAAGRSIASAHREIL